MVIRNPLGLEGSVTEGIISAIRTDQGLIQINRAGLLSISGNGHLIEHREGLNSIWKVKPKARRGLLAELKRHVAPDKVLEKIEKGTFELPEQKK